MKIYLYANRLVNVFNLPENISGSYSFDINDEEVSKLINVDARDGKWVLFATKECQLLVGKDFVQETVLETNKFYVLIRDNTNYLIYTEASDNKDVYDPRKVISSGKDAIYKMIESKINLFYNK